MDNKDKNRKTSLRIKYSTKDTFRYYAEKLPEALPYATMGALTLVILFIMNMNREDTTPKRQSTASNETYKISVRAKVFGQDKTLNCDITSKEIGYRGNTPYFKTAKNRIITELTAPLSCDGYKFFAWNDSYKSNIITAIDTKDDGQEETYTAFYR